jgi:hypothetical protein
MWITAGATDAAPNMSTYCVRFGRLQSRSTMRASSKSLTELIQRSNVSASRISRSMAGADQTPRSNCSHRASMSSCCGASPADFMARVRKAAGIQSITFSLSTRPILADTEDKAWDRAQDILARVTARTGGVDNPNNRVAENVGSRRRPRGTSTTLVCGSS